MSNARKLADLLGGDGVPAFSGTGAIDVPAGTTAQRPANPNTGYVRFNTTLDQLEQYTVGTGWQGISAPPTITTTDVSDLNESDATQTIVITGQNFDAAATATLVDANGVQRNPTTSVRNSSSQITITYSGGDVLTSAVAEPLNVKVVNGSGLSATLNGQISIDASPVWSTTSGTVATVNDMASGTHATLSATDPEGGSVTYTVASGALPGGLSLNSSTGVISGDPTDVASTTTSNFSVAASDGTGNSVNRSFNIIVNPYPDGSTSARAFSSTSQLSDIGATAGKYWMRVSSFNSNLPFEVSYAPYGGKGWVEVFYTSRSGQADPWNYWLTASTPRYMTNHGLTNASIADYGSASGSICLGSGFAATDFAVTSKSSLSLRNVAATGANENSALPLFKGDLAGNDAAALRTAFINYWLGTQRGFHAAEGSSQSGEDFRGGWSKAGYSYFEIVLSFRNGSNSGDEWHIADGSTSDGGTYQSNIGHRNQSGYASYNVGNWNDSTSSKPNKISSSNVLSVWLTSD